MSTKNITAVSVRASADLISEETPNYQYVAARLMIMDLRKQLFGQFEPTHIYDIIKQNIKLGVYDKQLLKSYSEDEFEQMNKLIKHDRDLNIAYAGMKQLVGKYLAQNRKTKKIYETPQFMYMLIGATVFQNYPKDVRMSYVKKFYDMTSSFDLSLPTPIMAGVRTPKRQYSSCVLIECSDTINSIIATTGAIVKYISQKAGIGIGASRIRGIGHEISKGHAVHTGVIPFYKLFQAAVKSCSQGGIRGGAATLNTMIWHQEIEDILVLKNNKGTEDNRVRRLDYCIQFNGYLHSRFLNNEKIILFSPHQVPDLLEAFYADQAKFKELYEKYEKDHTIQRTVVNSRELYSRFMIERTETSRIYFMNVDHTNTHSPFLEEVAPIRMSNLCVEIALPTKPLEYLEDPNGEIALCILAAFNLGTIKELSDLEEIARIAVRTLDELIDIQEYPVKAAEISTRNRRSLGIGVINYAYYLAKNNTSYSDPASLRLTHELFEAIMFYLLKASMELAKEKGPCAYFHETKYSKGILPIDTYKKEVDELCDNTLLLDWEWLRQEILTHGLRNSTLMAIMPAESSAQVSNATNGIEPPRSLVSTKGSKQSQAAQVVPEINKLKNKYELAWDMPDNMGMIKLIGIMQKFCDQTISANGYYDPAKFPEGQIPIDLPLRDFLTAYKYGHKTGYYLNINDGRDEDEDDSCVGGACKI